MKRLGEILVESGLLTPEQLNRALATAAANQQRLGEALVSIGLLSEIDIARALATQLGLEIVRLQTMGYLSPTSSRCSPETCSSNTRSSPSVWSATA